MDTTLLYLKLLLLFTLSSCSNTVQDTTVYNFDFQVQPNSEYEIKYHHLNNGDIAFGTETRFITSELIDTFGLKYGRSRLTYDPSDPSFLYETQRFINFKILVDKYITLKYDTKQFENYDSESKKLMESILPKPIDMESMVLAGHIIDDTVYDIRPVDEMSSNKTSNRRSSYIKAIEITNPSELHKNLPVGKMMVGDTFFLDAKNKRSLGSFPDIYILKRVKNQIAYFDIERRYKSLSELSGMKHYGKLEYNLTDSLYQYHESVMKSNKVQNSSETVIKKTIKKIR